jgi:hypothetical protein
MEIQAPRMKIQKISLNFGQKFFKKMFPKIIKKIHVKKCVFTYPISAPASRKIPGSIFDSLYHQ